MSFTAQVKDELSRLEGECPTCRYAQLSAIMRVCGTLSFYGAGRYSLRVSTETGAVARTMIKLTHQLFDLDTRLTVRHSVLHKVRNYLIEVPEQQGLEEALTRLGILVTGHGLASGVPMQLLERACCRRAFVRGAFMAGGFVADPRGDFHVEVAVTGESYAMGLRQVLASLGIQARINHRRGAYAIYLKSYDGVMALLGAMGATRSATAVGMVRTVKLNKNNANRQTNADMANLRRTTDAASGQLQLVDEAERLVGLRELAPALLEFCVLRKAHPELSLAQLGQLCDPPASKSAMYHRYLRLQSLVADEREARGLGERDAEPKDAASSS